MVQKEEELFQKFTEEMFKMQPIDFIGLAKLLCIDISNDGEEKLREMTDIVTDILNKFKELSNNKKKEILKICKEANKINRGGSNGNRSKGSHKRAHKSK